VFGLGRFSGLGSNQYYPEINAIRRAILYRLLLEGLYAFRPIVEYFREQSAASLLRRSAT
jgi:hypothetical protein